jgi:N-methylhydantoinase A
MSGKRVWVVGTDIGGTFTDVIGVNLETGEQRIGKVASTPPTFFDGVINGLARAGIRGEETLSFRHGATVSTNAILERKGVKTALITTEGFATCSAAAAPSAFPLSSSTGIRPN